MYTTYYNYVYICSMQTNKPIQTARQTETLNIGIRGWNRIGGTIKVVGTTQDGKLVCELDTPLFNQTFTIGKRGATSWKYKFLK